MSVIILDDPVEVEYSPRELARLADRERQRKRVWASTHKEYLAKKARERYRLTHNRVCPGTEDDPCCGVELTATGLVRCDYHAEDHTRMLRRAWYQAKVASPDA